MNTRRFVYRLEVNRPGLKNRHRVWDTKQEAYVSNAVYTSAHKAHKRADRLNAQWISIQRDRYLKARDGEV